jgi:dolichyl-phosphate beta-glucosyltransferase
LQSEQFHHFLEKHPEIRILFVNDGSKDQTLAVLREARRGFEDRIEILDRQPNEGKAEAVRRGMLAAIDSGISYVGFWDADLATPLEVIPEFLALLELNPKLRMVFGSQVRLLGRQVHRRPVRHYPGRVFASVVSLILRLPIYDTQCGAKLFRTTSELSQVLKDPFLSRWVFDVEILARYIAMQRGRTGYLRESIYEFPLMRWDDVAGSEVSRKSSRSISSPESIGVHLFVLDQRLGPPPPLAQFILQLTHADGERCIRATSSRHSSTYFASTVDISHLSRSHRVAEMNWKALTCRGEDENARYHLFYESIYSTVSQMRGPFDSFWGSILNAIKPFYWSNFIIAVPS